MIRELLRGLWKVPTAPEAKHQTQSAAAALENLAYMNEAWGQGLTKGTARWWDLHLRKQKSGWF